MPAWWHMSVLSTEAWSLAFPRVPGVLWNFACRSLTPTRFDSGSGLARSGRVASVERFEDHRPTRKRVGHFIFWRQVKKMIISMRPHATRQEIDHVCERIREFGYKVHSIEGEERVVIGVVGVGRRHRLPGIARSDARAWRAPCASPRRTSSSARNSRRSTRRFGSTASRSAATSSS